MKRVLLYIMAIMYISAGIVHFARPQIYLPIMPPWVPAPFAMVLLSGFCEILFGALLIPSATRSIAAFLLIALLIAVFPANVQMALNWQQSNNPMAVLAWLRLPLQAFLIWWAWTYTRS